MAKKKERRGKLAGKSVAFVGKFGYSNMFQEKYEAYVRNEGGKVVDPSKAAPDYLVRGEGRGGKLPGDLIKLQAKYPDAETLDEAGFYKLFVPTREEFIAQLKAGTGEDEYQRWDFLREVFSYADSLLDLSGVNLCGANLYGAKLHGLALPGANLSGVSAQYAEFSPLEKVKFDNADLSHAYFSHTDRSQGHPPSLLGCSFKNANLTEAWLGYGKYGGAGPLTEHECCDFTGATLSAIKADACKFVDRKFAGADLSDAELERSDLSGTNLTKANLTRGHATTCKFDGANLSGANLQRADLREASLKNADLRNADLREAVLSGADLTGAKVKGADFGGAVLTKVKGLDGAGAKNLVVPKARKAGPQVKEFARVAAGATKRFETSIEVDLDKGEYAVLHLFLGITSRGKRIDAQSRYHRDNNDAYDRIDAPSFEQAMLNCAERWPTGKLRLASIQAKGSKLMQGKKLADLALAAWSEAFGLDAPSRDTLAEQKANEAAVLAALRETMRAEILGGPWGIKKWNARPKRERQEVGPLHALDFKKANAAGIDLSDCDLVGSTFAGAKLKGAKFWSAKIEGIDFTGADLSGASLGFAAAERACFENAKLTKANMSLGYFQHASFRHADLSGADIGSSSIMGTDFTGANLKGTEFRLATYSPDTKFPAGFVPTESMELETPPPVIALSKPGTLDFATFFAHLQTQLDPSRLGKAVSMLKSERFKLFSEVKDDSIVGVVRSQSSKERVYSCRLVSDGMFGCCTQNLKPCGGLNGMLCKHLLVLIVGLARSGTIDPATVETWMEASKQQKPAIDREVMGDTFLRYTGAEAGEIDWRPAETGPEDYYVL